MNESNRIPGLVSSLADPSRLRVVSVLAEADCCVSDLARRIGLSQSCTTRHLQILQRAGVLTRTREGKRVLFRIRDDDPELGRVLELLLVRRPLEAVPSAPPGARAATGAFTPAPRAAYRATRLAIVPPAGTPRPNEVPIAATSTHVASDLPMHSDSPSGYEEPALDGDAAPAGVAQQLEDYLL